MEREDSQKLASLVRFTLSFENCQAFTNLDPLFGSRVFFTDDNSADRTAIFPESDVSLQRGISCFASLIDAVAGIR